MLELAILRPMIEHRFQPAAIIVIGLLLSNGCGPATTDPKRTPRATPVADQLPWHQALAVIDEAEDRRTVSPAQLALGSTADPAIRSHLALALGRIGDPAAAGTLIALLEDEQAQVRDNAAFACGLLDEQAHRDLSEAVTERLGREARPEGIVTLLLTLGRIGGAVDLRPAIALVQDKRDQVRAGALQALGLAGLRGVPLPEEVITRIASGLSHDADEVRLFSAFALYRCAGSSPTPGSVLADLSNVASADKSAEVRAYALRALARRGGLSRELLTRALEDTDDRVSATAPGVLAFASATEKCPLASHLLQIVGQSLTASPERLTSPYLHTVRAAFEAAIRCADDPAIQTTARGLLDQLARQGWPDSAGASLVRCLVYQIAGTDDVRLVACDPQRPYRGKQRVIARLAAKKDVTSDDVQMMIDFIGDADLRVAVAALFALARVATPRAVTAVVTALADSRATVVSAALDGISTVPSSFASGPPGKRNIRPEVLSGIDRVVERFTPFDHAVTPLISAAGALAALKDEAAKPTLLKLARDGRPSVRRAARTALKQWKEAIEPGTDAPTPTRPVSPEDKTHWRNQSLFARVTTTQGEVVIALDGRLAPGTVGSFVELARAQHFDDTEIHRVVPNFVVQAGDQTGTGLGDPGYALRCEVSSVPYRRGTVGMALAGRDTGGSQFFITLSRQPHLDGNYTVFGRVISGMAVADQLEQGDRILTVEITSDAG